MRTVLLAAVLTGFLLGSAAAADAYSVSVTVTGSGSVSATSPAGTPACTATCTITTDGTTTSKCNPRTETCIYTTWVELTATPSSGWKFDAFTPGGAVCATASPTCTRVILKECIDDPDCAPLPAPAVSARFADATKPSVVLSAPGGGFVRQTIPLAATASDNVGVASVAFSVRGEVRRTATSAPYTATFDTSSIADGQATVVATAADAAGNTAESAPVTVVIDNTAPDLNVTGPAGETFGPGGTQTWKLVAADATAGLTSLSCSVVPSGQAPAYQPCSGSYSVSAEPDGAYTFTALATDAAGNQSTQTRAFAIDATPPETTIDSGPANGTTTTATSITWGFSSNEPGSSFACRVYPSALTPGPFGECSGAGTHTAVGFAPGTYSFEVRATDAFGNVDGSPARRTFTVSGPAVVDSHPQVINALLSFYFSAGRTATRFTMLTLTNVPPGATVTMRCTGGCGVKSLVKHNVSGRVALKKLVGKRFKVGATITITVSKPGATSAVKILTIRKGKRPSLRPLCQPPGATKPQAC
jgi:hypothetical protein